MTSAKRSHLFVSIQLQCRELSFAASERLDRTCGCVFCGVGSPGIIHHEWCGSASCHKWWSFYIMRLYFNKGLVNIWVCVFIYLTLRVLLRGAIILGLVCVWGSADGGLIGIWKPLNNKGAPMCQSTYMWMNMGYTVHLLIKKKKRENGIGTWKST